MTIAQAQNGKMRTKKGTNSADPRLCEPERKVSTQSGDDGQGESAERDDGTIQLPGE